MQPDDVVVIDGERNRVGTPIAQGRMGAVFVLREPLNGEQWVIKAPLEHVPESEKALRNEYELLANLAANNPQAPPVPRVRAGSGPAGEFVLAMEDVPERAQLAPWVQQNLSPENLEAEAVFWQLALDYLRLLRTVYRYTGRSVTDRKLSDFRLVMRAARPRLIVLDWGLLASRFDEATDIRVFSQLWYMMVTMRSPTDSGPNAYHPLAPAWGQALTVGGRLILRKGLHGAYQSMTELEQALHDWVDCLERADGVELRVQATQLPANPSQDDLFIALRAADLLKRLDPGLGEPLYDEVVNRFDDVVKIQVAQVRQRATMRVRDARDQLARLRMEWKDSWQSLMPLLDSWDKTLGDLEVFDDERQTLGLQTRVVQSVVMTVREKLSQIYARPTPLSTDIAMARQALGELQGVIDRLSDGSQHGRVLALLRTIALEIQVLVSLLDAYQKLDDGMVDDACSALETAHDFYADIGTTDPAHQAAIANTLGAALQHQRDALSQSMNVDPTPDHYVEQMRAALRGGDVETVLRTYQTAQLSQSVPPYRRLVWSQIAEPAFLIQTMRAQSSDPVAWLAVLETVRRYLARADVLPDVARLVQAQLDVPYTVFKHLFETERPSSDTYTLILGETIRDIYVRCQHLSEG